MNHGANPTIASYNASAVKIYNAASSLVRFEVFYYEKRTVYFNNAGVVIVIFEVVCRIDSRSMIHYVTSQTKC
jgi:hypothetical protein